MDSATILSTPKTQGATLAYVTAARGKPFPEEINARIRTVIRAVLMPKFGGNQSKLAEALGLKGSSQVSRWVAADSTHGFSFETAVVVARLAEMSLSELLREDGEAPAQSDSTPARGAALHRLRGLVATDVERDVRAMQRPDLTEWQWVTVIVGRQEEHRLLGAPVGDADAHGAKRNMKSEIKEQRAIRGQRAASRESR